MTTTTAAPNETRAAARWSAPIATGVLAAACAPLLGPDRTVFVLAVWSAVRGSGPPIAALTPPG